MTLLPWLPLVLVGQLPGQLVEGGSAWISDMFLRPSHHCDLSPQGHKLPFGYHKQPYSEMDEADPGIGVGDFNKAYIEPAGYKPTVFRGMQEDSIARHHWTDNYLAEKFGHYKVLTEVKHELRQKFGKSLNTLGQFLSEYTRTNQYVVTVLPDEMRAEVLMPQLLQCGSFSRNLLELNLWMASGDTASQIHYDADHNIHCIIAGKKSFFMIHPDQYSKLQMHRLEYTGSNFCPETNQNSVDLERETKLADVDYQWTLLQAGDCIFIPSQYMHQVRSYGRSISVTVLWDPTIPFEADETCSPDPNATISQFNVVWNHKADDIFFDVGYATPHVLRTELLNLWDEWRVRVARGETIGEDNGDDDDDDDGDDDDSGDEDEDDREEVIGRDMGEEEEDEGWGYDQVIRLLFSILRWHVTECKYTKAWAAMIAYGLDLDKDLTVTRAELERSSDEVLKAVSHFVDAPNLDSEMYDFCLRKQFYVPPEVVSDKDRAEIEDLGSVTRWLETKGYSITASSVSEMFEDFVDSMKALVSGGGSD